MKEKLTHLTAPFRNKYVLSFSLFVLWMVFFDNHNLLDRIASYRDIRKLNRQKEYYLQKIREDRTRLNELKTSVHTLEKFAREQYLMKKENEDIYLVDEE